MRCRKFHKVGHAEIILQRKRLQQLNGSQIADEQEESKLFVATCFTSRSSSSSLFIHSGCTNHTTHHEKFSDIREICNL